MEEFKNLFGFDILSQKNDTWHQHTNLEYIYIYIYITVHLSFCPLIYCLLFCDNI